MKMKLIAIAAIALSPAVVLGQTRTHIRVAKDGAHTPTTSETGGDVTTTPAPAPAAAPAPAPEPTPAPAPAPSSTTTIDSTSNQYGTGAPAASPTHSQQTDSTMPADSSSMSGMKMDSSTTSVDTVRVPRNQLNVSPLDSVKMGIPSTRQTEKADSTKAATTP